MFSLDSDKDIFEKMMRELIATDGRYCVTAGDVGVLMQREKDKVISYSINFNQVLLIQRYLMTLP